MIFGMSGKTPPSLRLRRLAKSHLELIGVDRRSALEAFGARFEWSIGRSFAITFRSGQGVRLVVLGGVGGVARVGFGIEV
jgi:hypothetical protein